MEQKQGTPKVILLKPIEEEFEEWLMEENKKWNAVHFGSEEDEQEEWTDVNKDDNFISL